MATGGDIITSATPDQARDIAYRVLESLGFTLSPIGPYSANAERGSKGMTVAFGALAGKKKQHVKGTVEIFEHPGGAAVRFGRSNSGMAAGAIGVSRANSITDETMAAIAQALPAAG